MSKVVMPRRVQIRYRRLFFLIPQCSSLRPGLRPSYGQVIAYGLTRAHAKRRILKKIDPEMYWPGTVDPVSYTSDQQYTPMRRHTMDLTDIMLSSEIDALSVREALFKLLERYERVMVADYLELVGIQSTFSDQKIGWTELNKIEIKEVNGGFVLFLPEPKPF